MYFIFFYAIRDIFGKIVGDLGYSESPKEISRYPSNGNSVTCMVSTTMYPERRYIIAALFRKNVAVHEFLVSKIYGSQGYLLLLLLAQPATYLGSAVFTKRSFLPWARGCL